MIWEVLYTLHTPSHSYLYLVSKPNIVDFGRWMARGQTSICNVSVGLDGLNVGQVCVLPFIVQWIIKSISMQQNTSVCCIIWLMNLLAEILVICLATVGNVRMLLLLWLPDSVVDKGFCWSHDIASFPGHPWTMNANNTRCGNGSDKGLPNKLAGGTAKLICCCSFKLMLPLQVLAALVPLFQTHAILSLCVCLGSVLL